MREYDCSWDGWMLYDQQSWNVVHVCEARGKKTQEKQESLLQCLVGFSKAVSFHDKRSSNDSKSRDVQTLIGNSQCWSARLQEVYMVLTNVRSICRTKFCQQMKCTTQSIRFSAYSWASGRTNFQVVTQFKMYFEILGQIFKSEKCYRWTKVICLNL